VRYAYDARNRLTSLDDDSKGQPLASYTYDSLGRIAGLTRDNGVATRYRYDMAGQLTDIAHTQGGQALASSHYDLDTLGRRTAQTREDNTTESYRYDATSQLTGVAYGPGKTETFAYDPVGNRTEATALISVNREPRTVNFSYTTNALNQYARLTPGASAPVSFAYDTNGNLINDGRFDYVYDSQNRLVSVTSVQPLVPSVTQNPTPIRAEFTYDARNRCVLRKYYTLGSQGQWVLNEADSRALTYDAAWNLLAERTLSGQKVGAYLHGQRTDEILVANLKSQNTKVQSYYPLADGLGSTVAQTNAKGKVTDRYRYSAYGTPTVLTATYQLKADSGSSYRFLFTGREWLSFVQLNDHRYRYYSPGLGRWTTTDPIGFRAGDVNLYSYVSNIPVYFRDLFGLCCEAERSAVNAAAAVVAAAEQSLTSAQSARKGFSAAWDSAVDAYNASPSPPSVFEQLLRVVQAMPDSGASKDDGSDVMKGILTGVQDWKNQNAEDTAWSNFETAAGNMYDIDQQIKSGGSVLQNAQINASLAGIALTTCLLKNP